MFALIRRFRKQVSDQLHPLETSQQEFQVRANVSQEEVIRLVGDTLVMMGYPQTKANEETLTYTNQSFFMGQPGDTTIVHGITRRYSPMIYLLVIETRSSKEADHIRQRLHNLSVFER